MIKNHPIFLHSKTKIYYHYSKIKAGFYIKKVKPEYIQNLLALFFNRKCNFIMSESLCNNKITPEKHAMNIQQLKKIKENIAILIKNDMSDSESIPYFVRSSLETAFIDIAIYLEDMNGECDVEE